MLEGCEIRRTGEQLKQVFEQSGNDERSRRACLSLRSEKDRSRKQVLDKEGDEMNKTRLETPTFRMTSVQMKDETFKDEGVKRKGVVDR